MPWPLDYYVTKIQTNMAYYFSSWNSVANNLDTLATQLSVDGNPNAATACTTVANSVRTIRDYWTTGSSSVSQYIYNCFDYINTNWPSGTDVDMDAIINAMLSAEFEQLEKFIGIVDAYRIALWNAPFNAEFYGALARGFIKWPQY